MRHHFFLRIPTLWIGVLFLLIFLFAGCAVLNPGPPPTRLQLEPPMPPGTILAKPLDKQLSVALPQAGREIDGDAISLVFENREIRTLAGARWTSTVPNLLQRLIVNSVESTGILRGVSDETAGFAADARLLTDVRYFSLLYASEGGIPTARFDATFRLLCLRSGKILGTLTVNEEVPAAGKEKPELVRAMEQALGRGLVVLVPWIGSTMESS